MMHKNILQKGSVRYIVFREEDTWYAVGLEFNIVESGDTPREALLLLFEAIQGYVESARRVKARPGILNQKTDKEYEKLWDTLEERKTPKKQEVYTFGQFNLAKNKQDDFAVA